MKVSVSVERHRSTPPQPTPPKKLNDKRLHTSLARARLRIPGSKTNLLQFCNLQFYKFNN
jgi:hypothetical protein